MPEISWIKLKTSMFDDEKIQLIEAMPEADAILVIWIKLLVLAGRTNSNGYILLTESIPYSGEMLSTIFRRPLQIIKFALKILMDFGMIEITPRNVICVTHWDKHQNVESLDKIREQARLRQIAFRNKKLSNSTENKESVTLHNVTVTEQNKNKNKNKNKKEESELFDLNSNEFRLSSLLFRKIKERDEKYKEPNFHEWSKHIDKLHRIDKREFSEIELVILWSQEDTFWQNNILSTDKLRKKFEQLYLQMQSVKSQTSSCNNQQAATPHYNFIKVANEKSRN